MTHDKCGKAVMLSELERIGFELKAGYLTGHDISLEVETFTPLQKLSDEVVEEIIYRHDIDEGYGEDREYQQSLAKYMSKAIGTNNLQSLFAKRLTPKDLDDLADKVVEKNSVRNSIQPLMEEAVFEELHKFLCGVANDWSKEKVQSPNREAEFYAKALCNKFGSVKGE